MTSRSAIKISLWGGALVAMGIVIGLLGARTSEANALDRGWLALMLSARIDPLLAVAHVFDWLGGSWRAAIVIPLIVIAIFLARRRPFAALVVACSSLLSVAIVQLLKTLFGRARPEDILVVSDYGSFPSGHTANAATLMVVLILLVRKTWMTVLGIIWIVGMALSRTYLAAHWLIDTLAGIAVGTGATLIIVGAFLAPLRRERDGRPASIS